MAHRWPDAHPMLRTAHNDPVFDASPVLARFPGARLLGEGSESQVFALSETTVLRVPKGGSVGFWERRRAFCDRLAGLDLGFRTPVVLDQGELDVEGLALGGDLRGGAPQVLPYFVEERIIGQDLAAALPRLDDAARDRAFDSYLVAVITLGTVSLGESWWGEVLADDPVRARTWVEFLSQRVRASAAAASPRVRADLPDLDRCVADFCEEVRSLRVSAPHLVHGDFFPGNVIVDESGAVAGVVDFASLTMAGDPAMDIVGALVFLDITPGVQPADIQRLADRVRHLAPTAFSRVSTYRRFYALRYLHALDDPPLYRWCLETLDAG
jgi:Phosphotransferase enzyme family